MILLVEKILSVDCGLFIRFIIYWTKPKNFDIINIVDKGLVQTL